MNILRFSLILGKLKSLKRTGWVRSNIPLPESVAEHSYRVAVLAWVLAPEMKVDQLKAVKMALVHDLGEAEIGDIVTVRGGKNLPHLAEKIAAERAALQKIITEIDGNEEFLALFDEYEANQTAEARLIKQLDKLEMGIQAYEYETQHQLDLSEFFITADSAVMDPELKKIVTKLLSLRK